MKRFTLVLAACAALALAGCATTNDSRTGLRGEICAFGYCLAPQVMTAESVAVPSTAVVSGPVVAPATVLSQPAVLERTQTVTQYQAVAPAPPAVAYAPAPQLSK